MSSFSLKGFIDEITLAQEQIEKNATAVNEYLDKFIDELKKKSPKNFSISKSGSINTGSYYEKVKILAPNEFDVMVILAPTIQQALVFTSGMCTRARVWCGINHYFFSFSFFFFLFFFFFFFPFPRWIYHSRWFLWSKSCWGSWLDFQWIFWACGGYYGEQSGVHRKGPRCHLQNQRLERRCCSLSGHSHKVFTQWSLENVWRGGYGIFCCEEETRSILPYLDFLLREGCSRKLPHRGENVSQDYQVPPWKKKVESGDIRLEECFFEQEMWIRLANKLGQKHRDKALGSC